MIDIHTHILYDIDDGAKNLDESLLMIEMEIVGGIGTIVLTPHFDPHTDSVDLFVQKCRERYDILQQNVLDKSVTLILGSEILYSSLLMYYSTLTPLCITGTRYLLLEFSPDIVFNKQFFAEFDKIIQKFDITPIIAHIERYNHTQKHMKIIERFKRLDCVIQVNADYILKNPDSKFVKQLFNHNYIDIIASDCHDSEKRPPNLKEAISLVNEKYVGFNGKMSALRNKIKGEQR